MEGFTAWHWAALAYCVVTLAIVTWLGCRRCNDKAYKEGEAWYALSGVFLVIICPVIMHGLMPDDFAKISPVVEVLCIIWAALIWLWVCPWISGILYLLFYYLPVEYPRQRRENRAKQIAYAEQCRSTRNLRRRGE